MTLPSTLCIFSYCFLQSAFNTLSPIPQNGQAHSNNSSAICRRIVWVGLTFLRNRHIRVNCGGRGSPKIEDQLIRISSVNLKFLMQNFIFVQKSKNHTHTWTLIKYIYLLDILLLILSKFRRINQILFPMKSSENLWFSDEFRGNRS